MVAHLVLFMLSRRFNTPDYGARRNYRCYCDEVTAQWDTVTSGSRPVGSRVASVLRGVRLRDVWEIGGEGMDRLINVY